MRRGLAEPGPEPEAGGAAGGAVRGGGRDAARLVPGAATGVPVPVRLRGPAAAAAVRIDRGLAESGHPPPKAPEKFFVFVIKILF